MVTCSEKNYLFGNPVFQLIVNRRRKSSIYQIMLAAPFLYLLVLIIQTVLFNIGKLSTIFSTPQIMHLLTLVLFYIFTFISIITFHNPLSGTYENNVFEQIAVSGINPAQFLKGQLAAGLLDLGILLLVFQPLLFINMLFGAIDLPGIMSTNIIFAIYFLELLLLSVSISRFINIITAYSACMCIWLIISFLLIIGHNDLAADFNKGSSFIFALSPAASLLSQMTTIPFNEEFIGEGCQLFGCSFSFISVYLLVSSIMCLLHISYYLIGVPLDRNCLIYPVTSLGGVIHSDNTGRKRNRLRDKIRNQCRIYQQNFVGYKDYDLCWLSIVDLCSLIFCVMICLNILSIEEVPKAVFTISCLLLFVPMLFIPRQVDLLSAMLNKSYPSKRCRQRNQLSGVTCFLLRLVLLFVILYCITQVFFPHFIQEELISQELINGAYATAVCGSILIYMLFAGISFLHKKAVELATGFIIIWFIVLPFIILIIYHFFINNRAVLRLSFISPVSVIISFFAQGKNLETYTSLPLAYNTTTILFAGTIAWILAFKFNRVKEEAKTK